MGNGNSVKFKLEPAKKDKQAIRKYCESEFKDEDLEKLWNHFDKDKSGSIEVAELEDIVFHMLCIFWTITNPKQPLPKRDEMQSVIDRCKRDILNAVDDDENNTMSKEEFRKFGEYLQVQWKELQKKINGKNLKSHDSQSSVKSNK